jgi:hypothetical protein
MHCNQRLVRSSGLLWKAAAGRLVKNPDESAGVAPPRQAIPVPTTVSK